MAIHLEAVPMDNNNKKSIELEKEDYILATACGVLSGLIDAVFVGNPSNSILLSATDKMADQFVIKAAQFFWKNDKRNKILRPIYQNRMMLLSKKL